ncbi:MAG: ribosomal RNA small subunit methyltransferase A [Chloroflexi bacterium]|nr:ribosomal RNA small subunit methyltransferase A [Chloroflexota bacterium]MBI3339824.1 ribosomal RNA small subunit methyltransferase A [Chloroflexota bacterium]
MQLKNIPPKSSAALLKQHGLRADKKFGQNFLEDSRALENIVSAAGIQDVDAVLEIGPGLGGLTRHLAASAREVVAVELDEKLMPVLRGVLKPFANVRLIHADILNCSPKDLGLPPNYIVAANIPYNITSAIIRHLLESDPKPRRIVLTIQKEVAERICEAPPDMSLLALSVQVYGKPAIAAHIPASAFFPAPKVDSSVVRIEIYPEPLIPHPMLPVFFKLIKAGFSQKRKKLRNSLSAGLHIQPANTEALLMRGGIDPHRRAETLSIDEWAMLCIHFRQHAGGIITPH